MNSIQRFIPLTAALVSACSAHAVIGLSFASPTVTPEGSTTLEVVLNNPVEDATSYNLNAFSVQLAFTPVIPAGTEFSLASSNTVNPYALAGIGDLTGNDFFMVSNVGSVINFGDVDFDFGANMINPGDTLGLGTVTIDSQLNALPGSFAITFQEGSGLTELTDDFGAPILFNSTPGNITVVPEPKYAAMLFGLVALFVVRRKQSTAQ
ncbi:MAG: hypothetical protein AAFX93_18925 [Verrucomicrobiota bacterium]